MNRNMNLTMPTNATRNYSLHTITMRIRLQEGVHDPIRKALDKLCCEKFPQRVTKPEYKNTCMYYFDIARHFGFNEVKVVKSITKKATYPKYWLDIKINPWRLFHSENYPFIYIATQNDLIRSYQLIETMLKELNLDKNLINNFYLKRVDFCTNISLGSCEAVDEYMKLLHRGAYPYSFKRLQEYSLTQKRMIPTKNSFTVGSKETQFTLYNKYKQLSEEKYKYDPDEIVQAEGMVRIELRIDRSAIKRRENKYSLSGALEFLKLASEMASSDFPRYLKMIYGTGKFVTYKAAKDMIENSSYKATTKDLLLHVLSIIKKDGTIQILKEKLEKKDYTKCMHLFNELGISPITIGKRASVKEFENPVFYIENQNCNSPDDIY